MNCVCLLNGRMVNSSEMIITIGKPMNSMNMLSVDVYPPKRPHIENMHSGDYNLF